MNEDLHVERIWPSEEFQTECFEKCQSFFTLAILPELFGKFYSRPPQQKSHSSEQQPTLDASTTSAEPMPSMEGTQFITEDSDSFCYCNGPEYGIMVACDNANCPHGKWFHLECLQIKAPPRSRTWYCPDCRRHVPKKKRKV